MTLEKIKSLCKFHKDKEVVIAWHREDWDWPTFKVLAVDLDRDSVTLQGIATPSGIEHQGDIDDYPIVEIRSIKSIDEWTWREEL
jgi:hypothetical protein